MKLVYWRYTKRSRCEDPRLSMYREGCTGRSNGPLLNPTTVCHEVDVPEMYREHKNHLVNFLIIMPGSQHDTCAASDYWSRPSLPSAQAGSRDTHERAHEHQNWWTTSFRVCTGRCTGIYIYIYAKSCKNSKGCTGGCTGLYIYMWKSTTNFKGDVPGGVPAYIYIYIYEKYKKRTWF